MDKTSIENKYYFNLNPNGIINFEDLENAIKDYKARLFGTPDLRFVVLVNGRDLIAQTDLDITFLINLLQSYHLPSNMIRIAAIDEEKRYNSEEWDQFKHISNLLNNDNISFGFEDMGKTWTIEEAENANGKIRETSSKIQQKDFSPYEKLLSAYFTVTSRPYIKESKNEHYSQSRSIYGVLNSNKIVCVGFSELFKAIIEDVGDENIKIFDNSIATSGGNTEIRGFHRNLIVYIKDEKYGIDGYYYLDPTWDNSLPNEKFGFLNYFMVPLHDISELKGSVVVNRNRIYDSNSKYTSSDKLKSQNPSEKQKLINEPESQKLSFGKGGFTFSKEFLTFMASEPTLKRKMIDVVYGNSVLNTLNDIIYDQKSIKIYKQAIKYMSKQGSLELTYEDAQAFNKSLRDAIEKEDINIFIDVINDISQNNTKVNPEKEFIDNIRERLEKSIYDFDTEEKIAIKKEKITSITSSIEKLLEDPNNKLRLAQMSPQIKHFLYDRAYLAMNEDVENFIEQIENRLSNVKTVSPVTDLQQRLSKSEKGLESGLATLEKLDSLSPEFIAEELTKQYDPTKDKAIEEILLEHSQSIDLDKMSHAIRKVLGEDYKFDSKEELEATLQHIIEINREYAPKCFTKQATNAFSQNPLTRNDEIMLS